MSLVRTPIKKISDEDKATKLDRPSGRLAALTRKKNEILQVVEREQDPCHSRVIELYNEYLEKLEIFGQTCQEHRELADQPGVLSEDKAELYDWFSNKEDEIRRFKIFIEKWLHDNETPQNRIQPGDSASNAGYSERQSQSSRASKHSSVLSLRAKLADQRAKLTAETQYSKEKANLEEQEKLLMVQKLNQQKQIMAEELEHEKQIRARKLEQESQQAQQRISYDKQLRELELKKSHIYQENLEKEILSIENGSGLSVGRIQDPLAQTRIIPEISNLKERLITPKTNYREETDSLHTNQFVEVISRQNEISLMLARSQERALLPKNEPETFDGLDLTKYKSFIQSFKRMIENRCDNDSDKIYYLEKYTRGEPQELVKSCNGHNAVEGYQRAMELLEEEFGNEFRIASAYVSRIEEWPPIKSEDGKALGKLSIYLMSCANCMEDMTALNQLNGPKEIMNIVMKLPYDLRRRWRNQTHKILENREHVTFKSLVKFIRNEASIVNQPLFGNIRDEPSDKFINEQFKNKRRSFTTNIQGPSEARKTVESDTEMCPCCKRSNHTLERCFFFDKKGYEEKLELIKIKRLCFGCLREGHIAKYCKARMTCNICTRNHPTCLHRDQTENKEPLSVGQRTCEETQEVTDVESTDIVEDKISCSTKTKVITYRTGAGRGQRVVCAALPVKIRIQGTKQFIQTYMGIDNFSSDCFMNENLLSKLKIKGFSTHVSLTTMEGRNSKTIVKVVNNLELSDLDENEMVVIPVVYSKNNWPFSKKDSPREEYLENCPHLQDIPFKFIDEEIGILVGINMPEIVKPLEMVDGENGSPYATLHKFGWALNGPINPTLSSELTCHQSRIEDNSDLEFKIEQMFSREFGDSSIEDLGPSVDDQKWESKVQNSLRKRNDGHYEIGLPLRESEALFPSNRDQVYGRLRSTIHRMRRNKKLSEDYQDFMNTMLEKGFAERVPSSELMAVPGKVWYLVHHGIYHKQKQKLRVVFDCSLKFEGSSLNDRLFQGPDLTNNLLGVLLRFRQHGVAFMGDIEKMFYQVKVPKDDADLMRFFWFPDGDLEREPVEYRLTVHVFGAVSSPSCANFALRQTTCSEEDDVSEESKKAVMNSFYVDDLIKSVEDDLSAITLLREVRTLVSRGGFNLTSFVSNSRVVLNSLPPDKLAKDFKDLDLQSENLPYERALGVVWNVEKDTIGFKVKLSDQPYTRRGVLSTVFSIYDPFGIVGPATITARRIFQQACHLKLPWDEQLPAELVEAWKIWLKDIALLDTYEIPRCFKTMTGKVVETQLHIFCDGSEVAYGAVAYLRFRYQDGEVWCSLVMAKTRLTPVSASTLRTIPRIELNAARLAITVQQILHKDLELEISSEHFWTDSTTVLKYLHCETKRFQRFVYNRVTYIRSHSSPDQWSHVPGKYNPADLASRGSGAREFIEADDWKLGPEFLWKDQSQWPSLGRIPIVDDADIEVKKSNVAIATYVQEKNPTERLLESSSNWYRTKCRIAWVLRLKQGLHEKIWAKFGLSIRELSMAEIGIWKFVQGREYSGVIDLIRSGKCLKKSDVLTKLSPFLDEVGLLRVGGRLDRATTSFAVKHPIILPCDAYTVLLLVRSTHHELGHLGRETVLSALRNRYWIVGGNLLVRRVIRDCIACRKRQGKTSEQIMASLPEDRVTSNQPVFTNTGIDYFGPFLVSRKRSTEKRYGVIFTCLASRAMHLEVAYSLNTDSFISSLRRFVSRRGPVRTIRSDNGTNFVGGNRELRECIHQWNTKHLEQWMKQNNIEWKFQPPVASHFGGVWEREIRTIRKVLSALTNEQPIRLNDEGLSTLMCEVENILNNRPLTEISSDPNDLEALTPNHLLLLSSGVTFPPGLFNKDETHSKQKWRQVQYLADLFWTRWRKEYLPLLQERQKWTKLGRSHQIGDLVLVMDQLLPRNQWCLGRIVEVTKDVKGQVRIAKIKVSKIKKGSKSRSAISVIERPIVKLILLRSVDNL